MRRLLCRLFGHRFRPTSCDITGSGIVFFGYCRRCSALGGRGYY